MWVSVSFLKSPRLIRRLGLGLGLGLGSGPDVMGRL